MISPYSNLSAGPAQAEAPTPLITPALISKYNAILAQLQGANAFRADIASLRRNAKALETETRHFRLAPVFSEAFSFRSHVEVLPETIDIAESQKPSYKPQEVYHSPKANADGAKNQDRLCKRHQPRPDGSVPNYGGYDVDEECMFCPKCRNPDGSVPSRGGFDQ